MRGCKELTSLQAMFSEKPFRLKNRTGLAFQPRLMCFKLDAAFSTHEVDRMQAAFGPFLEVGAAFRIKNMSEAFGMDPVPWKDPWLLGFMYGVSETGPSQGRISRRRQPYDFRREFLFQCRHDGERMNHISKLAKKDEENFRC